MNELQLELELTEQERIFLKELLNRALIDTRVEEHRTRTPTYREHVVQNEHLIEALLCKLGQAN